MFIIFRCGGGSGRRDYLNIEELVKFLNETQRDPRLNEILYPYVTPERAKEIIHMYEPNKSSAEKGKIPKQGFEGAQK